VAPENLDAFYAMATASIHLCPFDSMPNSVCEALCCGVPVICTNTGGTPEVVREGCGRILGLDTWDGEPTDTEHPPPINRNMVAQAITQMVGAPRVTNNAHVDIKKIAQQYTTFFRDVM